MVKKDVWGAILALRESCDLFLQFPVPDSEVEDADREEDERVIRQQIQAATLLLQSCVNVLGAHVFNLYGDPTEGGV